MLSAVGKSDQDWTSAYRVFARGAWDVKSSFGVVVDQLQSLSPAQDDVVTSLDDTKLRKTGTKIPGVSYQRDPMSPPFHTNFIRAQRFVQLSWNVPLANNLTVPARAFPVAFQHAPSAPKPKPGVSAEKQKAARIAQKEQCLSQVGVNMLTEFRQTLDDHGASSRQHIVTVDGSYTNCTVLKNLPTRTVLIGRIRKDAVLSYEPVEQPQRGRRRSYGKPAPTPEELRQDDSVPWRNVPVFAAGRVHTCQVKTLAPVLWPKAGADQRLRMVVIKPLGYRLCATSRLLYRQPAFLICTSVDLPLERLIQYYFWRWDIEVNHRDEKQLIGVGHAQVRSPKSADRLPPFAVLSYSFLLIAAARRFGLDATNLALPRSKWCRSRPLELPSRQRQPRLSTAQILAHFREALPPPTPPTNRPNFSHFAVKIARHLKCPKSLITQAQAIAYATH